jgi:thioredoxin reductase (NADPH)
MAMMARAYNQAQKFGVEMVIPNEAEHLSVAADEIGKHYHLTTGGKETVRARVVIIATGARYRRLDVANLAQFEGSSVHYWASPLEARLCSGQEVALVGAGNSAGQAAVFLAGHVKTVWLIVRGVGLEASMSRYLIERIEAQPNIKLLTETTITALNGLGENLQSIQWRSRQGEEGVCSIGHMFLFIGADPNTDWLAHSDIAVDTKGFVKTGDAAGPERHMLETSRSSVYAIGDVRSGSIKRVAAAVGEGAQVVAALHAYLAAQGRQIHVPQSM